MPAINAPEYAFDIVMMKAGSLTESYSVQLTAAYFVEDGSYTLFKDKTHAVTAAFKTDFMVFATRGAAHYDDKS